MLIVLIYIIWKFYFCFNWRK